MRRLTLLAAAVVAFPCTARAQCGPPAATQTFFGRDARGGSYWLTGSTFYAGNPNNVDIYCFTAQFTYAVPAATFLTSYAPASIAWDPYYAGVNLPAFGGGLGGVTVTGQGAEGAEDAIVWTPTTQTVALRVAFTPPPTPYDDPADFQLVTLTATPEPTTFALAAGGALLLVGLSRNTRRGRR